MDHALHKVGSHLLKEISSWVQFLCLYNGISKRISSWDCPMNWTVLCSAQHGARHTVVGDWSVASLLMSLFPLAFRGRVEAAQRAPPQRLHGAELPEPEPRPQPAHQPCPGGAGSEECGLHRRHAGALAGLAGGRDVDCHGHLCHRPQRLPSHADLQPDSLELLQPRPQVGAGGSQTWRPAQVALGTWGPQRISKGKQPDGQWDPDPDLPPLGLPFVRGALLAIGCWRRKVWTPKQVLPTTCTLQAGYWGQQWLGPSTMVVLPLLVDPRVLQVPCLPPQWHESPPTQTSDSQTFLLSSKEFVLPSRRWRFKLRMKSRLLGWKLRVWGSMSKFSPLGSPFAKGIS